MATATQIISNELRQKIVEAIKTRSSLEMLLLEEQFEGTRESIIELLHLLREIMGNRMMLEFVFSSHIAIWEEYRKMIDREIWLELAQLGDFNCDNYTLLGTSLIYKENIDLGKEFLTTAASKAFDTKSFISVADAIHAHLKDNDWAEKVLLEAADHCSTSDHYCKIAEALITIAEDREMSITMFKQSLELVTVAHEYMEIATAVVRALKDKSWAEEIFAKHTSAPQSGTPIEMLAEEAYEDELKLLA